MKLIEIAIRNVKRNKKRSLLSITATAISTTAIVFMFSFIAGMSKDMEDISHNYSTGEILIRHGEYDDKSFSLNRAVDDYKDLLSLIESNYPDYYAAPRLTFPSTVLNKDRSYMALGVGVDFNREENFINFKDRLIEGELPKNPREAIIGVGLARELNLSVNDKFTPIATTRLGASSGITLTISGIGRFSDPAYTNKTYVTNLDLVPIALKMEGSVSEILIKNIPKGSLESVKKELNIFLEKTDYGYLEAKDWKEIGIGYVLLKLADYIYTIIAFFFFALASSVIANTMLMVVFERRNEIGTLTAMGMDEKNVVRLFFYEAFVLGVLGAFFGVLVGVICVVPLSYTGIDLSSMAEGIEMGSSFNIFPQLSFKSTVLVFVYSVFVASFISYFPSRGAAKVDPIIALRGE